MKETNERLLTPRQAAALLHVSPVTIRYWAKEGILNCFRTPGGHRRFKAEEIETLRHKNQNIQDTQAVLIISDDQQHNNTLVSSIRCYNDKVQIDTATNSFNAGSLVHTLAPQLIILDLSLQSFDGINICRYLKENQTTKHTPLLLISSIDQSEISEVDFLEKPIIRNQLMLFLEQHL